MMAVSFHLPLRGEKNWIHFFLFLLDWIGLDWITMIFREGELG